MAIFAMDMKIRRQSILDSLEFIAKAKLDVVNTPIIVPTPGTPLYQKLYDKLEFKEFS